MQRFTGLVGLVVMLAIAWLFSAHKREIKLRLLAWGVGLQFAFALLVLKTDFGRIFQAIGVASNMIGAGRDRKEDSIDPAVGIILEVKVGEKVDAGSVLCRIYYTKEDRVEEAAEMVEDAFRVSGQKPDERELILEVVG